MNRGKMKKVLALMLTFIFVISATACGGATKFDAEAYVRGVMDANYKQKYDEYAKARGISEKDAKAEIEDTLDEQVDTELSGLEALGDFTEEEKQEYKDMLVKIDNLAKYEVKEAKEDKDGNFTVTIEVTPSDVYQTPIFDSWKDKNGYKPSKHGLCSRFLFRNDMCYIMIFLI